MNSPPTAAADLTAVLLAAARPLLEALAAELAPLVAQQLGAPPKAKDAGGDWLSYDQAAKVVNLPASCLREAARTGKLAVNRLGARTVRIARADLLRFLERRRVAAKDEPTNLRTVRGGRR